MAISYNRPTQRPLGPPDEQGANRPMVRPYLNAPNIAPQDERMQVPVGPPRAGNPGQPPTIAAPNAPRTPSPIPYRPGAAPTAMVDPVRPSGQIPPISPPQQAAPGAPGQVQSAVSPPPPMPMQTTAANATRTAVVGAGDMPPWFSRLWETTANQPQFQNVNAERHAGEQGLANQAAQQATGFDPRYGGYNDVQSQMPQQAGQLDQASTDLAMRMLQQPGRYDTDLFQQLQTTAFGNLSQAQDRDQLNLLRDSNARLGPRSGQLTNEYIDLADQYDQRRHDITLDLLREAALTNSNDMTAAIGAGRGVSGDVFNRSQSLRNEDRFEREFDFTADQAQNRDQLAGMANLRDTQQQMFGQDQSLRNEARGERQAGTDDRLRGLNEMYQFGNIDRTMGRDAMDDYFRQAGMELQGNESQARIEQQDFMNSIALAQLMAQLPASGDPTVDQSTSGQGPAGALQRVMRNPYLSTKDRAAMNRLYAKVQAGQPVTNADFADMDEILNNPRLTPEEYSALMQLRSGVGQGQG